MAKALDHTARHKVATQENADGRTVDWRRGMSGNVAYALLTYTGLQIFMTVHAMERGGHSTLPYFALVVLILAIIPACRWFEKRWVRLDDASAAEPSLRGAYRRDQIMLWLLAVGLPFALTGLCKVVLG